MGCWISGDEVFLELVKVAVLGFMDMQVLLEVILGGLLILCRNGAVFLLVFLDVLLNQIFNLHSNRTFILVCNIFNFLKVCIL